ncbi:tol-pal system protein YbgF [Massilia sp. W12]|uniref:tol-pal system protein YbgF n=1 Tax=Massilia sp. W12 TaxID=3126507 RepID=UPI0030D62702
MKAHPLFWRALRPLCAVLLALPVAAHAGLFDDDEARKAILDLRAKVEALRQETEAKLDTKSSKSSTLDLVNQNEQLRQEMAKLRGQIEVLSNEVANLQRRQKDFYTDLDARLRKLEPQKVVLDGKEANVDPAELKSFEAAVAEFKSGDYKGAAQALSEFQRRYPDSPYTPQAAFTLGNTLYALRDCKSAIPVYKEMARNFPEHARAPDALLSIASCMTELKEKPATIKKALEIVIRDYPDSSAAQTAKERLGAKK